MKVYLRDVKIEDVDDRYKWSLDKDVTAYLNVPDRYPPFSKEETKEWLILCISHRNGYYQKAIVNENGIHIGWVDLKNIDKINRNAELGIAIGDRRFWGKGYGSLALIKILEFGFNKFTLEKIWLRVDSDNNRAKKCYEKNGFVFEGVMRKDRLRKGIFIDRCRYSILKDEFKKMKNRVGFENNYEAE